MRRALSAAPETHSDWLSRADGGTQPAWNESFEFNNVSPTNDTTLVLVVKDQGRTFPEEIGQATVPLHRFYTGGRETLRVHLDLKGKHSGEVVLIVDYEGGPAQSAAAQAAPPAPVAAAPVMPAPAVPAPVQPAVPVQVAAAIPGLTPLPTAALAPAAVPAPASAPAPAPASFPTPISGLNRGGTLGGLTPLPAAPAPVVAAVPQQQAYVAVPQQSTSYVATTTTFAPPMAQQQFQAPSAPPLPPAGIPYGVPVHPMTSPYDLAHQQVAAQSVIMQPGGMGFAPPAVAGYASPANAHAAGVHGYTPSSPQTPHYSTVVPHVFGLPQGTSKVLMCLLDPGTSMLSPSSSQSRNSPLRRDIAFDALAVWSASVEDRQRGGGGQVVGARTICCGASTAECMDLGYLSPQHLGSLKSRVSWTGSHVLEPGFGSMWRAFVAECGTFGAPLMALLVTDAAPVDLQAVGDALARCVGCAASRACLLACAEYRAFALAQLPFCVPAGRAAGRWAVAQWRVRTLADHREGEPTSQGCVFRWGDQLEGDRRHAVAHYTILNN